MKYRKDEECLKPCPFCGFDKNEWKFHTANGNPVFNVECRKCGAKTAKKMSSAEAVAAWNRRAEPQTMVIRNGNNNAQIENCGTLNL